MTGQETGLHCACKNRWMHTCSNVCCLHMLTLWTQTNIFPLCYLRMPVILHMQSRLSKHVTKNGGWLLEGISLNRPWQKPPCLWLHYSDKSTTSHRSFYSPQVKYRHKISLNLVNCNESQDSLYTDGSEDALMAIYPKPEVLRVEE